MKKSEFTAIADKAQVAKVAGLADIIWRETYAATLDRAQIDYMLEKFQSQAAIERQMAKDGYEYFLIEEDGAALGYIGTQAAEGKLFLSKLYLLADARGGTLTKDAFDFLDMLAKQRGCNCIWLTVNRHNLRAIAAYKKYGFHVAREQVADIGGGFVMDDYVMEKPVQGCSINLQ